MTSIIHKIASAPPLNADWLHPAWTAAETLEVKCFRPESGSHRPHTLVRLLHDERGLHGIFLVQDRYVRCVRTEYGSEVWKDACVEFFAEPKSGAGYVNFEFNCGGAFLCSHVTDPTRTAAGLMQCTPVPAEIAHSIQVRSSLPRVVEPEITEPVTWTLQFFIPFALFEPFIGPLGVVAGSTWRGNFFKCAEDNSHPHWASWSPVDELNFHLPRCFGEIHIE